MGTYSKSSEDIPGSDDAGDADHSTAVDADDADDRVGDDGDDDDRYNSNNNCGNDDNNADREDTVASTTDYPSSSIAPSSQLSGSLYALLFHLLFATTTQVFFFVHLTFSRRFL